MEKTKLNKLKKVYSDREDELSKATASTIKPSELSERSLEETDDYLSRLEEKHEDDVDDRLLKVLKEEIKK